MQRERITILGCAIDRVNMTEAVEKVTAMVESEGCRQVITLNAEIIYQAVYNQALQQMINRADLVTPDGAGVVWAAKYLGCPVKERVTGIDLVTELVRQGAAKGWQFYFLGASPGVADEAASKLTSIYPQLRVVGTGHGYFTTNDETEIVEAINRSGANILLVGLGAPRQDF
ncbi:MAG: WecB/TagA/CpsF family glycosyltransferase, partial [Methylocystaceae bacterium]